jgi:hypothetical protein
LKGKGLGEPVEVIEMFYTLRVVMVIFVKTHETTFIMDVFFTKTCIKEIDF